MGIKQEPPRLVYVQLVLLADKCQLRINRGQWWLDALLLLRLIHAQIAVELPDLSLKSENPFAQRIDFLVDSDELTGQIVSNSAQASLLRVIRVPARAHRVKLRPEVEDRNVDSDSADPFVSIVVEI